MTQVNEGDTALLLAAGCVSMLMTPALGFFFGGLVRRKNILHMIMQCIGILLVTCVVWALLGYSLAFGSSKGHFIGGSDYFVLRNIDKTSPTYGPPTVSNGSFFFFQLSACALAPAIIVGSSAERFGLLPSLLFSCIWILIVYSPICHWMFHEDGWLKVLGTKDFAGGIVVHVSAGFSSIALAIIIERRNPPKNSSDKHAAHNITYTLLGTALLWFGWLGLNAGSAFSANGRASLAIASTNLAAASGCFGWILIDYILNKKISAIGIARGNICGLVSISVGCGFCPTWSPFLIGFVGAVLSHLLVSFKEYNNLFDDALDVFACHGIAGAWGAFAVGLVANDESALGTSFTYGGFYGHGSLMGFQAVGVLTVGAYSFALSFIILYIMKHLSILRVTELDEELGLDKRIYGEEAYIILQPSV